MTGASASAAPSMAARAPGVREETMSCVFTGAGAAGGSGAGVGEWVGFPAGAASVPPAGALALRRLLDHGAEERDRAPHLGLVLIDEVLGAVGHRERELHRRARRAVVGLLEGGDRDHELPRGEGLAPGLVVLLRLLDGSGGR